ncbi:MAG: AI-2E family transporter [Pseudomonadota bacterium]
MQEQKQLMTAAFSEALIRFAAIAFTLVICVTAFLPFLPVMLWAIVLAIALFPVHQFLQARLGGSPARSATVIALAGVLLLGIPTAMVGNSLASKTLEAYEAYQAGELTIPAPSDKVAEWPLVGERLHDAWGDAAEDLPRFVETRQPQLESLSTWLVSSARGAAGSVFLLIGAFIIAGIMLAWAGPAEVSTRRIFVSFSGDDRGPELHELTTKTIRQVAVGIIGIAFLTALVFGATVALAGVPASALLTLLALLFAIMQIPVTIVALVAAGLLWSGDNTAVVHNSIFTVLMIAASLVDNVLKPLILGRGLSVPMPVVLLGAVGGMMSGGILGMFIGAAFLAAGYQIFMSWVESDSEALTSPTETAD